MTPPTTPPESAEIYSLVDDTLHGLDLRPEETASILGFANKEIPSLLTPETSYFVLGSYRSPFVRRVRMVENELNKRIGAYAFLVGDLEPIGVDRLPEFRITFHLLGSYVDFIVAVHEQDAGGEITELGTISETPYFEKAYVFPRDYSWTTDERIDTRDDVISVGMMIYYNEKLSQEQKHDELASLLETARKEGIDIDESDLVPAIRERENEPDEYASYSWVHINEFRLFELHERCRPWFRESELRDAVEIVPASAPPRE
jgi:hypothetical protein